MSDAEWTGGQIRQIRGGKDSFVPPDGPVRRLAAILAADISGYSRLMSIDEEGTYARVTRQRRETHRTDYCRAPRKSRQIYG